MENSLTFNFLHTEKGCCWRWGKRAFPEFFIEILETFHKFQEFGEIWKNQGKLKKIRKFLKFISENQEILKFSENWKIPEFFRKIKENSEYFSRKSRNSEICKKIKENC